MALNDSMTREDIIETSRTPSTLPAPAPERITLCGPEEPDRVLTINFDSLMDGLLALPEPSGEDLARLSLEEAAEAVEYLEDLAMHGFEAEAFGRDAFRISAVPQLVARRGDVIGAFLDALGTLLGSGGEGLSRAGRVTATVACKAAVKLGDRLTQPGLESLIEQWLSSDLPATCLHGRTICYRIASSELARKLDRT